MYVIELYHQIAPIVILILFTIVAVLVSRWLNPEDLQDDD
jgi:hypothetical protein